MILENLEKSLINSKIDNYLSLGDKNFLVSMSAKIKKDDNLGITWKYNHFLENKKIKFKVCADIFFHASAYAYASASASAYAYDSAYAEKAVVVT